MRYMVLTKRALLTAFVLVASTLLLLCGISNEREAIQTAKTQAKSKKIPVYAVQTEKKQVAITFDAAWGAEDTETLLSILEAHHAKATIFAVGDFVREHPDAIQKFSRAGHQIANHSDTHTLYTKLSKAEIQKDIEACNAAIERVIGTKPKYVRAPSGAYNEAAMQACAALHMQMVQWSVDSLDWQGLSAEEIQKRVLSKTENGSILLFHNDVKNTPEALETILTALQKQGYAFVTVQDLLYTDAFTIDHTGRQKKLPPKASEKRLVIA